MTRIALCFPGQGSQRAGMAEDLLAEPAAAELLEVASSAGLDLEAALRAGDGDALRPTEVAQPALLLVETVLASMLPGGGTDVVGVAGHSVGEFAACVAARALTPPAAMRLVVARGRAMAAMSDGAMLALLGAAPDQVEAICRDVDATGAGRLTIANLNGPGQVVLSGDVAAVEAAAASAASAGVRRTVRLNVSGAFHSPLMAEAGAGFSGLLDAAHLDDPVVPVVCNVDAEPVRTADALRRRLRGQMTSPVRWAECVTSLVGLGAECLVEIGPGTVLSGLARRIAPDVATANVATAAEARSLAGRLGVPLHG